MRKILKYMTLGVICFLACNSGRLLPDNLYDHVNVWYKVSSDPLYPGEIVPLNMKEGYSFCKDRMIYIVVNRTDDSSQIVLAFPNGGYWDVPDPDSFSVEIQKEFDQLYHQLNR